jgi:hypothetical protein
MKQVKSLLIIAIAGLIFAASPNMWGATFRFGDISIAAQPPLPGRSTHGYAEYSFIVQNSSTSKSHVVTLEIPKEEYSYGYHIYPLSRTVKIAPQTAVKLRLYQPYFPLNGRSVRVIVDGKEPAPNNDLAFSDSNMVGYNHEIEYLISKSAMSQNPPELQSNSGRVYVLSNIPVKEWSDNWLAFSRYSLIIVTSQDFEKMSIGTQNALINYAECGGILVIKGEPQVLNIWKKFKKTENRWNIYDAAFGKIYTTEESLNKIPHRSWNKVYRAASTVNTILSYPGNQSVSSANKSFSVIKRIKISPTIVFFIMLIFAIIIGPVNILILSRKKKKIWLLWTVPAGALIFTVILLLYALSSETWGGHTRSRTLTLLDENSRRAVSLGKLAYYYPVPPAGGLRFSNFTEISTYGASRSRRTYSVDWTNGQHLKAGWLTAKVPCQLMLRKNESRRERLEIQRHNGKLTVTNGLGAYIEKLSLWDFDNKHYLAENIKPGAKIELKQIALKCEKNNGLHYFLTSFSLLPYDSFNFIPGSYVAKLKRNPFVEPGREFSASHRDEATLIGIMRKELK